MESKTTFREIARKKRERNLQPDMRQRGVTTYIGPVLSRTDDDDEETPK